MQSCGAFGLKSDTALLVLWSFPLVFGVMVRGVMVGRESLKGKVINSPKC